MRHYKTRKYVLRVIVITLPLVFAGCPARKFDQAPDNQLSKKLSTIDTTQLTDHSTTPPITVEEATEQFTQKINESNEPNNTIELTLEQVRTATLANNLDLKVELVNPSISKRSLDEERAKFDPELSGSTDFEKTGGTGSATKTYSTEVGIDKPLPTGGSVQFGLPISETNNDGLAQAAASVTYIQSLLRGAGTSINTQSIRIAEHQWNIINSRTKLTAIHLLANADIAYWYLYAARKELDVRREQYKLAQDQLINAQKKVAAGSAPKIEIVRAEAGLAGRLDSVINAETSLKNRQRDLLRIMNREDIPLETTIDIIPKTDPNPLGLELDPNILAEQALANRMELIELEQLLTIDEMYIELARNSVLPDLTLSYTYRAVSQDDSTQQALEDFSGHPFNNHSIGLSASIPLGNRAANARLQKAKLEKIQDLNSRDRYRQIIRQEVYEAVSNLHSSWRRILAAEQGVTAAYRDYRVEQSQFQLGVSTSTNVLYSATGLADAQLRRIYAFADYEVAQINLARATGTLLGNGQIQITPVDIDTNNLSYSSAR